jgi:squalene cyclase
MAGLFAPHLCVTAAAALVPGFRHTVSRFLREHQHADGRWVGYWWCDDEYPTGIAALALGGSDDAGARGAARRGADWASTRIRGDGAVISGFSGEPSAFCAASAALAILGADASGHAGRDADGAAARAVRWLLEAQRADGSWEPSALMRIPPADATVASDDAFGAFVGADTAAIFTTATALRTLRLFRAQES